MSDILSPQGFESAEPLQGTDVQEVYQPTSGGIRRNKQTTLAALKQFFQKLATFTAGNIVESDGVGNLRTTSIKTTDLSASINNTNANTNAIINNINQPVKTDSSPIFASAEIAGHNVDAELSTLNNRVGQSLNPTDNVAFATINTGQGANKLYAMNQNVRMADSPTFAGITSNGRILTTATPILIAPPKLTASGQSYVFPRGIFSYRIRAYHQGTTGWVSLELSVLINGFWASVDVSRSDDGIGSKGGSIVSDGSNVRVFMSTSGPVNNPQGTIELLAY